MLSFLIVVGRARTHPGSTRRSEGRSVTSSSRLMLAHVPGLRKVRTGPKLWFPVEELPVSHPLISIVWMPSDVKSSNSFPVALPPPLRLSLSKLLSDIFAPELDGVSSIAPEPRRNHKECVYHFHSNHRPLIQSSITPSYTPQPPLPQPSPHSRPPATVPQSLSHTRFPPPPRSSLQLLASQN